MSFDSEFDYTGSISFIDNYTDSINVEISSITTSLSDLGNVDSSFDYLTNPKIEILNRTQNVYNTIVSNFQELKGEINIVTTLDNNDKSTLFQFYSNALSQTTETKEHWMARMLFNTPNLIADAGNVNIGVLSTPEKGMMAELICEKYPIHLNVSKIMPYF